MKKLKIFLLLLISINAFSQQTNETIQSAFIKSYEYETNGDYTKAIQSLKNIYDADNYSTNLRLGWLHYSSGLFTESTTYYQKCIALMPYSIECKFGLILPLKALGNWTAVKGQYEKILKVDAKNSTANYNIGLLYYGQKNYKTALSYFEKVTNLYPFDFDSSLMLAWSHLQLGNYREAKILFDHALLIQPENASAKEGLTYIK